MKDLESVVADKATALFGGVVNVIAEMSQHSPATALAYLSAQESLRAGVLRPKEREAVMFAVSAKSRCHYCTAAHRMLGTRLGVSESDLDLIGSLSPPRDERLAALTRAAWQLMEQHGFLESDDLSELERAGVGRAELYEVVAIIGTMTISNYVNHIAKTELDIPFRAFAR